MFKQDLQIGHHHEALIAKGFAWYGIDLTPTQGKHPFDFYLPDGRSLECKVDFYSAISGNACIELPTLKRAANFYAHTFCFTKIFTYEEYKWLYMHGKVATVGEQRYDARLPSRIDFKSKGVFIDTFIKGLK